jgi:hypothetical protein
MEEGFVFQKGSIVTAQIWDLYTQIKPNGKVKITVDVFTQGLTSVWVGLVDSKNQWISVNEFGENKSTKVFRPREISEDSVSEMHILEFNLPKNLTPGEYKIVADAIGSDGKMVLSQGVIGGFQYKPKKEKKKTPEAG